MDNLFKAHSKCIKIYIGREVETDPYEHTKSITHLLPISIKGIVTDLTMAKVQWAMPGIIANKAKEIIIEKKHRALLEMSQKIQIAGESDFYEGWRVNGKMQLREEDKYIRVYIYLKTV